MLNTSLHLLHFHNSLNNLYQKQYNQISNHQNTGLAVDRENGWICHLSYTHKVASAWEGRHRVSRPNLMAEYSGKRALSPS